MIAPRIVPAPPCPLGHPPLAWLDKDGDARCCACRPPGPLPESAGLAAGVSRRDAQDTAAIAQRVFLKFLWPTFGQEVPREELLPKVLRPGQGDTTRSAVIRTGDHEVAAWLVPPTPPPLASNWVFATPHPEVTS